MSTLWEIQLCLSIFLENIAVADPGEGPGGPAPPPPIFLYQTEARRAEKLFLEARYPHPLQSQGLGLDVCMDVCPLNLNKL